MKIKKFRFIVFSCLMILAVSLLMGCGTAATESEFYQHDAVYKNWDHMRFSWDPNPVTEEAVDMTNADNWWGISMQK